MTGGAASSPALRPGLPPIPRRIRALPVDARGYPVPWFVQWFLPDGTASLQAGVGVPDFRVVDGRKPRAALKHNLCWICGQGRGTVRFAFVVGPMCAVNRVSGEPPAHVDCATFSAQACPFLTLPKAQRREANKPDGTTMHPLGLRRNPGVALVWITDSFQVLPPQPGSSDGALYRMGSPRGVLWFAEGRQATREEIMASIESGGCPTLRAAAEAEGADAVTELERETAIAMALVPAA